MPEPNVSELPREDVKPLADQAGADELASQVLILSEQKAELQDLLQRRQAEFDNFRRRTEREKADFAQYAGTEFIREILPIADDFERALTADSGSKDYAKGVEMIYNRLIDTLKKLGLEPIETAGKAFDPHIHQAVEKVHTAEAEDNTVLGEFQRGYFFKGKLLRPSMVRVAVRP